MTVEVANAKATKADFLLLVCRLNDAIVLRREIVKQRWNLMGMISPGSPGMYENQFFQTLGKLSEGCISNVPWYDPKSRLPRSWIRRSENKIRKINFAFTRSTSATLSKRS